MYYMFYDSTASDTNASDVNQRPQLLRRVSRDGYEVHKKPSKESRDSHRRSSLGVLNEVIFRRPSRVVNDVFRKHSQVTRYTIHDKNLQGLLCDSKKLLRKSEDDWHEVLEHFKITPQIEKDSIATIRHWYNRQSHLPQHDIPDVVLRRRLLTCEYSVEKVKVVLDNYYTVRNKFPEVTMNRDPLSDEIKNVFKMNKLLTLPQLTPEGHRVTLIKTGNHAEWSLLALAKTMSMVGDYKLYNEISFGDHAIVDLKEAQLSYATQINPSFVTKILFYVINCLGIDFVGVHYVNAPSFLIPILNVIKKMVKPELSHKVHIYDSYEQLMEVIPRKILPKDFGGEDIDSQEIHDMWIQTLSSEAWRNWFLEQDKLVSDESKRSTKSTSFDDVFGVDGSFRKIEID